MIIVLERRVMTLFMGGYTLDLTDLPLPSSEMHGVFAYAHINRFKPSLILHPQVAEGEPSAFIRYMVGMTLEASDGKTAQDQGQLIIGENRIQGMFTEGRTNKKMLDGTAGSVYCFSFDYEDLAPVEKKTNWRGKVAEFTLRSKRDAHIQVQVLVFAAPLHLKSDGQTNSATVDEVYQYLAGRDRVSVA